MIENAGEDKFVGEKLPDGEAEVEAAGPNGRISDIFGMLKKNGVPSLSIEEIDRIAREGWSGK